MIYNLLQSYIFSP